jgi:hypothetical protein
MEIFVLREKKEVDCYHVELTIILFETMSGLLAEQRVLQKTLLI